MIKKNGQVNRLVSIVTPNYNGSITISETIKSIQGQAYKNWELIIVDDNSSDNSVDIIKEFQKDDKRIRLIINKSNLGVTKTRNIAIDASIGPYIAFLDSDDVWLNEKLNIQILSMERENSLISYTSYYKCNYNLENPILIKVPNLMTYNDLLKTNLMGCLTVVYNSEVLGKKYFKECLLSEDYVLWLEILKDANSALGIIEPLGKYRVAKASRSSNKLNAIKYQWHIYRKIEQISFIKSSYYFFIYLVKGYSRYIK